MQLPTMQTTLLSLPGKRVSVVLIHVFCWMIFFAFPVFLAQREDGTVQMGELVHHLTIPLSLCCLFYTNFLWLIPKWLFQNKTTAYVLVNVCLLVVFSLILYYVTSTFVPPRVYNDMQERPFPPRIIFLLRDVTSLVFGIGLSIAVRLSIRWREAEDARKEAERSRTEAELRNLRNQLNPHFLLNTLNNIYALIAFDSEKAQTAVLDLSKLLRYVLYENTSETVPLNKEVAFLKNYIALMQMRLGANVELKTRFDTAENSDTPIAPLVFISLIENAFKHGVAATEKSFIHIEMSETPEKVVCHIENSLHPKSVHDKSGSGIGLKQVKKRLELQYAGQYTWHRITNRETNTYTSTIEIYTHPSTPLTS